MELSCEDIVERGDFVLVEVVFLTSGITDEVEEELEKGALVVGLALFGEAPVEDLKDGLKSVLKEDVWIIACDKLVGNDDQLGVVLDVGSIDGLVVRRDGVFYLLEGVAETVLEEISDLVLAFVKDLLQTLQEWLDFFPCCV